MLDSTGNADKAALLKAAEKAGIELRILIDDTQLVAEELGLTRALEVAILDPKAKELVYRGALNDRFAEGKKARRASEHYVADALTALHRGSRDRRASIHQQRRSHRLQRKISADRRRLLRQ